MRKDETTTVGVPMRAEDKREFRRMAADDNKTMARLASELLLGALREWQVTRALGGRTRGRGRRAVE